MSFELRPREIVARLLYIILALLFANGLGIVSRFYFNAGDVYGLVPLFDFNKENNVPTLYSSFALVFASALIFCIALVHKRNGSLYLSWGGLALIFMFLSIDEAASIHEKFNTPVRELLNTTGLFYFAWVIPYGMALIVFVLAYLKFLLRLPKKTMILFIVSGATFVAGAIGFELIGARQMAISGSKSLAYALFYTCEEFLEMLGIVLFIYALLTYIVAQFGSFTILVAESRSR